jgi:hypothetical protein
VNCLPRFLRQPIPSKPSHRSAQLRLRANRLPPPRRMRRAMDRRPLGRVPPQASRGTGPRTIYDLIRPRSSQVGLATGSTTALGHHWSEGWQRKGLLAASTLAPKHHGHPGPRSSLDCSWTMVFTRRKAMSPQNRLNEPRNYMDWPSGTGVSRQLTEAESPRTGAGAPLRLTR